MQFHLASLLLLPQSFLEYCIRQYRDVCITICYTYIRGLSSLIRRRPPVTFLPQLEHRTARYTFQFSLLFGLCRLLWKKEHRLFRSFFFYILRLNDMVGPDLQDGGFGALALLYIRAVSRSMKEGLGGCSAQGGRVLC